MNPVTVKTEASSAEYWTARFEQERERLVKLWVAYKALEAELDDRDALRGADR